MDDSHITDISQLKDFLKGSKQFDLSLRDASIEAKYQYIDHTIDRLHYQRLPKKEKRVVIAYLKKLTGYKRTQLFRLIQRARVGKLKRKVYRRQKCHRIYTAYDIKLLERTDEYHLRLNAISTKEILRREYEKFHKAEYHRLANISPAHINNLRKSELYKSHWVNHTKARQVSIGITRPPESFGKPGCIRVDTVHQKDIYHINAVDTITQFEIVIAVSQISERTLTQTLEEIVNQFPFVVFAFHSDRGGEYINYTVARLLQKLLIEQTKSRSYRSHDNALAETKNGSVVRKNFGWEPINQALVDDFNQFYRDWFNAYLNYHRPCLFCTKIVTDPSGRKRKIYDKVMTPYETLKQVSIDKQANYLKPGLTFDQLDIIAYQHSDNDFAAKMRAAERKLFEKNRKANKTSK